MPGSHAFLPHGLTSGRYIIMSLNFLLSFHTWTFDPRLSRASFLLLSLALKQMYFALTLLKQESPTAGNLAATIICRYVY